MNILHYKLFSVQYASFIFVRIHPKYLSFDGVCKAVANNGDNSECLRRCLHLNIIKGVWSQPVLFELTPPTNHINAVTKIRVDISLISVAFCDDTCQTELCIVYKKRMVKLLVV